MRRKLRIFLPAVTILSLLLCCACVFLWIRGYFRADVLGRYQPIGSHRKHLAIDLISARGGMVFWFGYLDPKASQLMLPRGPGEWYWGPFADGVPISYAGGWA